MAAPDYEVAAALYPDPKILYDPDPQLQQSIITKHGAPFGGATLGATVPAVWNYVNRRPLRAGILMYIPWCLGFAAGFEVLHRLFEKYASRRDQIHKHYVMLHPELFPPPPKVKIADTFEDWMPVR